MVYYYIAVLLLVAFTNVNAQIAPSNITLELIPSAQSVIEGNDFMFSCNSTESLNISILIDGSNSSNKFDRIIIDKEFDIIDSNFYVVNFSLANTTYADNGTVFTCVGVSNDTQYNSTDFTLQVYYPPRLSSGDNMTQISEFETGFPIHLNASVLMANPPIDSFNITYDATNTTGINATTTDTDGMVTIKSPVPSNRGNYTFNATNPIGSTIYTYRTFIGGAADELNITCDQHTVNERAIINCTANDTSDAPALGVYISVPGLIDQYYVQFTEIPAVGLTLIPVNISLYEVSAAKYNLYIESVNMIGNVSVLNEAYYIQGLFVDVYINATNRTITEGGNFTFDCSTPPELQNYTTSFTVLVNDLTVDDRIVTDGTVTNGTQSFVFTKTSYLDDGAVFVCVANETARSDNLNITILYAPKYFNVLETVALVSDAPGMLSVNMSSNPPPTFAMWTLNGVLLLNDTERITYNASQIEFTSVIVNDTGNYTVIAGNEIGNSSFSFMAEVYYAPIIEVADELFGYYNTSFVLSIKVDANPSNYTTMWYKDDEELQSGNGTTVNDNNVTFASLTPSDNATYTVHVNNSIGGSMEAINLGVYFGPLFAQLTNDTIWMEYATDSNFSYICEVVSSFPTVTELNFTSTQSEDLDVIKNETKSIQLRITKASQKNRQNYTCLGDTGYTSGYTTFQTFVGGAPDGVTVNVSISHENGKLNFFITIFDSSDAPARNLLYTNPITNKNESIEILYPLFDGMSYAPADEFLSIEESELTGGEDYLLVYSNNSLGEHFVANISILSIPTITPGPSPTKTVKKSKGAAIAAGILVPICVIALVVGVAVVVFFYMKNKRKSYAFSALGSMSNDNERDATVTTYGTGQIND